MLRPHGQGRDQPAERLEHPQHQRDRHVGERCELFVGLLGVCEEALQPLQEQLVGDIEQIGHPRADRIADQRHRLVVAVTAPHLCRQDRADRVETGVVGRHLAVLVEDLDELAEVSRLPVAARALALLEDRVDRALRRGEVGHGHELRPAKVVGRRLGPRRTDKQPSLTVLLGEMREAVLNRAIKMADRGEVLAPRHDVALLDHRGRVLERGREPLRVLELHPLGTLEEHEVAQRRLAERNQRKLHAGRIVARWRRHIGTGEVGRRADRRQQVVHEREVEHLLGRHVRHDPPPAVDGRELALRQPFIGALFERERGEQVLTHDPVLELGRLAEHVDQRLAMLDHERRLGAGLAAP
jgi:hypothetical protein